MKELQFSESPADICPSCSDFLPPSEDEPSSPGYIINSPLDALDFISKTHIGASFWHGFPFPPKAAYFTNLFPPANKHETYVDLFYF